MLSILVIDEALHQPQVVSAVFAQAQADREDATTEYGGLLAWKKVGIGAGGAGEARKPDAATGAASEHSVVMLYMPRSAQRISDTQFTASDDMVGSGDLALAHYHFHVQKEKNAQFAGPSRADLEYADRFGRSCIVLTAVKDGVMAVDYYQRGGVVVDMGGLVVNGNEQMSK